MPELLLKTQEALAVLSGVSVPPVLLPFNG